MTVLAQRSRVLASGYWELSSVLRSSHLALGGKPLLALSTYLSASPWDSDALASVALQYAFGNGVTTPQCQTSTIL
jgi:hypothetical protein